MTKQIVDQKQRMAAECQWWKELYELSDKEDVAGFYQHYAKYLEWNIVISDERKALHRMAILVGKALKTAQDSPVPLSQGEEVEATSPSTGQIGARLMFINDLCGG